MRKKEMSFRRKEKDAFQKISDAKVNFRKKEKTETQYLMLIVVQN